MARIAPCPAPTGLAPVERKIGSDEPLELPPKKSPARVATRAGLFWGDGVSSMFSQSNYLSLHWHKTSGGGTGTTALIEPSSQLRSGSSTWSAFLYAICSIAFWSAPQWRRKSTNVRTEGS